MLKEHFVKKNFEVVESIKPDPQKLYSCFACKKPYYIDDIVEKNFTCPDCGHYFPLTAFERARLIADPGSFREIANLATEFDPLQFPGYAEKREQNREATKLSEAVLCGKAKINGDKVILAIMDPAFLMGSMGVEVGERVTRAIELAAKLQLPLIIFSASGGARMQEGIYSLVQMAKTATALKRFQDAGGLYISVCTHPTMGGVTASFAMLGDIILAEKGALVGFAGPRVIQQTIGQTLPNGFQQADYLEEHGIIDAVVERQNMKAVLSQLLQLHLDTMRLCPIAVPSDEPARETAMELPKLSAMERVRLARDTDRPTARDFIAAISTAFFRLSGDRNNKEYAAIVGGIARINGIPVTIISQQKGRTLAENSRHNFGMAQPQGYRKALRLAKQAEKFGRPILTLVDIPGAYCGIEAEANGQAIAIAECLREFSALDVPSLALVIGEGGSGGALALSVTDQIWMCENAVYSVLSPEGFASILWKDAKRAEEAAELMRLSAQDLLDGKIIDRIISEAQGFAPLYEQLREQISEFFINQQKLSSRARLNKRYQKFRKMGL